MGCSVVGGKAHYGEEHELNRMPEGSHLGQTDWARPPSSKGGSHGGHAARSFMHEKREENDLGVRDGGAELPRPRVAAGMIGRGNRGLAGRPQMCIPPCATCFRTAPFSQLWSTRPPATTEISA